MHTRLELHVLIEADVEFDLAIWSPHLMSTWGFLCFAFFWVIG